MGQGAWYVVGAGGMLGRDVVSTLTAASIDVVALTRHDLDITDPQRCLDTFQGASVVVNCAAYTAVDDAELHEADAFAVNAVGAANLAAAADAAGARLVHVSSDYVFDGSASSGPLAEMDPLAPNTAYGRTKAAGEWAVRAQCPDHVVVRTAWLYGKHGNCFPKAIGRLLSQRDSIQVVDDQIGQPTWTQDVAGLILRLVQGATPAGTYHGTSSGETSWWEFARAVAKSLGLDEQRVERTTSDAFPRPAARPAYSALGHQALAATAIEPIDDWRKRWLEAAPSVLAELSARR